MNIYLSLNLEMYDQVILLWSLQVGAGQIQDLIAAFRATGRSTYLLLF